MTTGTDYATLYRKAYTAYGQGKMEEAAMLVESMSKEFPDDANICYCKVIFVSTSNSMIWLEAVMNPS